VVAGGLRTSARDNCTSKPAVTEWMYDGPAIMTWTVAEDVVGSVHHREIVLVASEYSEHPTLHP
jgi:hypothetical protein